MRFNLAVTVRPVGLAQVAREDLSATTMVLRKCESGHFQVRKPRAADKVCVKWFFGKGVRPLHLGCASRRRSTQS